MPIPESQLDTWAHQGSITNSSSTYNAVKSVLEEPGGALAGRSYEVFLQGSYGNDTNIWKESDVDVVIKLNTAFQSDTSELGNIQKAAWNAAYNDAVYGRREFKRDVLRVLSDAYGSDVKDGDKAIAIAAKGNRRKSDVIVALNFRRYSQFTSLTNEEYVEGICFWNSAGDRIANYPKQHSANLTQRHQASGSWLKPLVRIFKNIRGRLVDDGLLKRGIAPSYYIEGLLYNVPIDKLKSSYGDSFVNVMNWYQKEAQKEQLVCANEQYYLLRENSHVSWSPANCAAFVASAIKFWNEW